MNISTSLTRKLRKQGKLLKNNVVRVHEAGLLGRDDTAVLDWAVKNNHILITKDRATIPPLVAQRLAEDIPSPHILIIRPNAQLNSVLSTIEAIVSYNLLIDWQYPIRWIP